ncbi:hypothetical protein [Rhodohalobacter sp. 614A]|uniref:hypothetical protein n=1 Tax=Rhodohalobacter sp. 614A TaxID=2908649 RepID=UPI001F35F993|nr:hypothetical protein [Rhodohalobacter sp. 614A]
MGVQIDLIVPPIIIGLLIILIFRLNAFIMETSVDNRLNNDMQTFAEVTSRVIQEEVKKASEIDSPGGAGIPDTVLEFIIADPWGVSLGEKVTIQRSGRNLEVIKENLDTATADTVIYPSSLSVLEFNMERKPDTAPQPYYLNVKIETESNPNHHASMRDLDKTVKGFAENEIYLRNVHRICCIP